MQPERDKQASKKLDGGINKVSYRADVQWPSKRNWEGEWHNKQ